ncbi:MAG TPA: efflux RND transporter periplasmic adaptor subunit [Candidatus Krumholzibacteria bacterium]|nr:efflux RND transporter periplasmic adaptor subunit [Candidatus Krumholzibacteria bacterium]
MFPTPRRRLLYSILIKALVAAAFLPALAGCGKNGSAQQAQGGGPGGGANKEAPVPVAVAAATTGEIASYYTATATLAAEKEAQMLSRVSGVVSKLLCEEGDVVAEGAELLLVDNDEYRYRHEQAVADRADLEARVARLEKMREQDLVSAEEFETLSNDLAAAKAAEGMAQLNLSYTRVTAPFSGRIVTRNINVGQTINVGTPLFVISDFTPLLARVHVPAKEFHKLEPNQPVDLTLESNGTRLRGRIKLVSPTIDPSSGTIKVTIEIPTFPAGVRPGDFAQVSIVTERRMGRTLIPKVALVNDRGEQVVYVSADSTAERRVVEIGFQDDNNAEIVNGVSAGEAIVVKGQRTLKHGSAIKILDDAEATQVSDTAGTRAGS